MRSAVTTLAFAALTAGVAACGSCRAGPAPVAGEDAAASEPPAPPPEGLLAKGWISSPDASWGRLQSGVGGAIALLPPRMGDLACALLGLDARVAPYLDGKAISHVVLADGGAGEIAWALAIPLTDGRAFAALLLETTDASPAHYTARGVAGMQMLESPEHPLAATVAIAPSWLVVARNEADLARLGPYLVRSMPTEMPPAPASMVLVAPQSALAGPLSSGLAARWADARSWLVARDEEQRAGHGGRAPDFGDPRAVLDALDAVVKRRIALISGGQAARVEIHADDVALRGDLFVTPGMTDAALGLVVGMHPGDTQPLADVSAEASVALLVRDDLATRSDDAREIETALERALGPRLHDDDVRAMRAAVDDWAHARGDWLTAAMDVSGPSSGVWLRTPVPDGDSAVRAVREIVDLSRRPTLQELLGSTLHLRPAAARPVDVSGFGRATLATFDPLKPREAGSSSRGPGPLGVAWGVRDLQLMVATGADATQRLASEVTPAHRLGDDPRIARALAGLGGDTTFVLFAQPLRFDPARAPLAAPAVLAWGRKGADAWARLELADALLRELVRLKAGL